MSNFALISGYIIFIFLITKLIKNFYPENQELLRKIIHIGIGPLIPFAKFLAIEQGAALFFAGGISLLILINYIYKLFPIIEDVDRKSFGTLFYCLSLFILISIFWDKDPLALIAGYFVMTFGDGLAGVIGKNIKSKDWKVFKQKKSFIGTSTMFITSFIVVSIVGYLGNYDCYFYYFCIALIATLLEQISIIGIDNLSVPLISAFLFNSLVTNIKIN